MNAKQYDILTLFTGQISEFMDYRSTVQLEMVCKGTYDILSSSEWDVWKNICSRNGIAQRSTRTRGRVRWKDLLRQNLCLECRDPGHFIIGRFMDASRYDLCICTKCYKTIVNMSTWGVRKRDALPRARQRMQEENRPLDFRFWDFLNCIPYGKKKKRKRRRRSWRVIV